jgi:O-antigen ligase
LVCIVAITILFFTFSRSAMLTLAMLIIVLYFTIKTRKNRKIMLVCLALVAVIGAFQLHQRMEYYNVSKTKVNLSDFGRLSVGYAAVNIIKEHWFLGVGFENGRFLVRRNENPKYPIDWNMVSIHNVYLAVTAELGIIGLSLLLLLYGYLFTDTYRLIRKYPFPENLLFIFTFCVILSYILHGMVYHIYFSNHAFYFLILLNILSVNHEEAVVAKIPDFKL